MHEMKEIVQSLIFIVKYQDSKSWLYIESSYFFIQIPVSLDHWTTVATLQHILAFVILRLVALKRPIRFKAFSAKHATVTLRNKLLDNLLIYTK